MSREWVMANHFLFTQQAMVQAQEQRADCLRRDNDFTQDRITEELFLKHHQKNSSTEECEGYRYLLSDSLKEWLEERERERQQLEQNIMDMFTSRLFLGEE